MVELGGKKLSKMYGTVLGYERLFQSSQVNFGRHQVKIMAPNQESTQSELCVKGMRQEQSEKQTKKPEPKRFKID